MTLTESAASFFKTRPNWFWALKLAAYFKFEYLFA